jgi:HK97 family phage prohead protease
MTTVAERLVDHGLEAVLLLGAVYRSLSGIVVPYNQPTDVGFMVESFDRGAFTGSYTERPNVPLLLWHDNRSFPIGHAVAGAWDERFDGLYGEFVLAMTPVAQVAGQAAAEGFLTGMSVGFSPIDSSWHYVADWNPDLGPDYMDHVVRHRARLVEVSLTPTPAYDSARVHSVASEAIDAVDRALVAELRQSPPDAVTPPESPAVAPVATVDERVGELESTVENHGIRITALEGLGGNLDLVSLTPDDAGGEPAPQAPID